MRAERVEYRYDAFNKLKRYITLDRTARYAYNFNGICTLKWVDGVETKYIINGGDVLGEVSGGETTTYLRGINLICTDEYYYIFDAHGDVVNLTDANGNTIKTYEYDAFGIEKNPDDSDSNPFRYCGEYWDSETETYYLRARNYDPNLGRFTSEDIHWNVSNMIYGDNPQKINEREDMLGLKTYSYAPSISAIVQSSNLYVYCVNNPVVFADRDGRDATAALQWWTQNSQNITGLDGPYPYADAVYLLGFLFLGIFSLCSSSDTAVVETYETSIAVSQPEALSIPKAEEKVKEKEITATPTSYTPIYRYYSSKGENLSPRMGIDFDGLSFSTNPPRSSQRPAVRTTIEAVNATGVLMAIRVGNHVSIVPVGGTVLDWMQQGASSIWTLMLSSIVTELN